MNNLNHGVFRIIILGALMLFIALPGLAFQISPESGVFQEENMVPGENPRGVITVNNTENADIEYFEFFSDVEVNGEDSADLSKALALNLEWKGEDITEESSQWTGDHEEPITMRELEEGVIIPGLKVRGSSKMKIDVLFRPESGNEYQGSEISVDFHFRKAIGSHKEDSITFNNRKSIDASQDANCEIELKNCDEEEISQEHLEVKEYPIGIEGRGSLPQSVKIEVSEDMSNKLCWSYVNISYIENEIGLKENSLSLWGYNKEEERWHEINGTYGINGVNFDHDYVWGKVYGLSSFERFGVAGETKSSSEDTRGFSVLGNSGGENTEALEVTTPRGITVHEGETVSEEIIVENIGEKDFSQVVIDYSAQNPGWITRNPKSFSLDRGESKKIDLTVSAPEEIEEEDFGTSTIKLDISAGDIVSEPEIALTVAKRPGEVSEESGPQGSPEINIGAPENISIDVNGEDPTTDSRNVTLSLEASNASECRYNNDGIEWTSWESYKEEREWTLSEGDGIKTVFYQCRNNYGQSEIVYDYIRLERSPETQTTGITGFITRNQSSLSFGLLILMISGFMFYYWRKRRRNI